MRVLHARADGSYVIERGGYPYHVTADDPLYAAAMAAAAGLDLPPEPGPPALPPGLPVITPLQARRGLRAAGLLPAFNAWLATQAEELVEEWEYATEVRRDGAVLSAAFAALGHSAADLDAFFVAAAQA